MAQFVFNCPHCSAKKMAGQITSYYIVPQDYLDNGNHQPRGYVHASCGECLKPVSGEITSREHSIPASHPQFVHKVQQTMRSEASIGSLGLGTKVVRTVDQGPNIPKHTSPLVAKAFKSAEMNLHLEDGEDASATMYRKAIDVAIREKHPVLTGSLHSRIISLAQAGDIPPALKDWGDQIRWIGNDGAHDPEGVTRDDLNALRGFADAFLRYFISLPFEVALRRGQIDESGNPIQEPENAG
jgi:hypothetical protein